MDVPIAASSRPMSTPSGFFTAKPLGFARQLKKKRTESEGQSENEHEFIRSKMRDKENKEAIRNKCLTSSNKKTKLERKWEKDSNWPHC